MASLKCCCIWNSVTEKINATNCNSKIRETPQCKIMGQPIFASFCQHKNPQSDSEVISDSLQHISLSKPDSLHDRPARSPQPCAERIGGGASNSYL